MNRKDSWEFICLAITLCLSGLFIKTGRPCMWSIFLYDRITYYTLRFQTPNTTCLLYKPDFALLSAGNWPQGRRKCWVQRLKKIPCETMMLKCFGSAVKFWLKLCKLYFTSKRQLFHPAISSLSKCPKPPASLQLLRLQNSKNMLGYLLHSQL